MGTDTRRDRQTDACVPPTSSSTTRSCNGTTVGVRSYIRSGGLGLIHARTLSVRTLFYAESTWWIPRSARRRRHPSITNAAERQVKRFRTTIRHEKRREVAAERPRQRHWCLSLRSGRRPTSQPSLSRTEQSRLREAAPLFSIHPTQLAGSSLPTRPTREAAREVATPAAAAAAATAHIRDASAQSLRRAGESG